MVSFQSVSGPDEVYPEDDDTARQREVLADMADWDARFARWSHEEGLRAMRESGDPETVALADRCNCAFCRPGRGRQEFG